MAENNFQQFEQKVEKIEKVEKVDPSKAALDVLPAEEVSAAEKAKFAEAVQKADTKWDQTKVDQAKTRIVAAEEPIERLSPIDEMRIGSPKIDRVKNVTVDQIVEQSKEAQEKLQIPINKIEETQKTRPDVRISGAHDAILTDRLIHVDSSLKTALSKVGVEVTAQEIHQTIGQKPLVKYLNMLTSADQQLSTLVSEVTALNNTKERLTPEKLMAVQIKISFVTQEIEFFTNVLNKALEGTKTIMNVQV